MAVVWASDIMVQSLSTLQSYFKANSECQSLKRFKRKSPKRTMKYLYILLLQNEKLKKNSFRKNVQPLKGKGQKFFLLREKGRLYSASVDSVILYLSQTWPVKVDSLMEVQKNDSEMFELMYSVRSVDWMFVVELGDSLELTTLREYLRNRLLWVIH